MNNWWEDIDMPIDLKEKHNTIIESMNVPKWALITCPFCNQKLNNRSVRNISLRFNARNLGDISLEFCCDNCSIMDTMYFKEQIKNIAEFKDALNRENLNSAPVREETMYKMQYNNLLETIFKKTEDGN
jgi:hypothetical protein